MRKSGPLVLTLIVIFLCNQLHAQTSGGWGNCEFSSVTNMNAFDPSSSQYACKKAYVSATDEHYLWDGTSWILNEASSTGDNIYNKSDTLTANRKVMLDGNNLTFEGTNDVHINSDGQVGINTTSPSQDLDVNGIANVEDRLYVGPDAGTGSTAPMRVGKEHNIDGNTYQLYSNVTVSSPILTALERTSYGAYFSVTDNKTEDIPNGFKSYAVGGAFFARSTSTGTFGNLYGVRGYARNLSSSATELGNLFGGYFRAYNNSTTASVPAAYGSYNLVRGNIGPGGDIDIAYGTRGDINPFDADVTDAYGAYGYAYTYEGYSGSITNAYGVYGKIRVGSSSGGNISKGYAGYFFTDRASGGTLIDSLYGIKVDANDGQIVYGLFLDVNDTDPTENYGLFIDASGATTNNYGIYGEEGDWVLHSDGDGTPGGTGSASSGDLFLGEGLDLELYHNGVNSYIANNTGDLYITSSGTDDVVISDNGGNTEIGTNGGNTGIGTSTPDAKLDIENGTLRLSDYGSGTVTGTETNFLAVDSNGDVIEIGATDAGLIPNLYTQDDTLQANRKIVMDGKDLTFDGTRDVTVLDNGRIAIGNTSPTAAISISNDDNSTFNDDIELITHNVGSSNTYTPEFIFKRGTGTFASPGTMVNGDRIGRISFKPYTGSSYSRNSYIDADYQGDGTTNLSDMTLGTSGSSVMYLDEDGNVGIGNSSPNAKLDVENGSLRLSDYGDSSPVTGTEVRSLGVTSDGDVIEVDRRISNLRTTSSTFSGASRHNYTPANYTSSPYYEVYRLNVSSGTDLTGVNSTGVSNGQKVTFLNIGSATLTLKYEDVNSTAANRFILTNYSDTSVPQGGSVTLIYDSTSSRWRVYALND